MKSIFSFLLIVFLAANVGAQGIEFFHGSWDEAIAESKKTGKPLFVDAFAEWCGPCKRMAATTFKDASAGEFFNKNFINVKMDAEKGDGLTFRKKYPISAYPTLFFISDGGEVIHKAVGGQDVNGLLKLGAAALGKVDYSKDLGAEYEKGNRDPQLMLDYLKALNKSGKSSLKVANEYLRTQKDLSTEFNLRFIHEAATEADSRIFDLLIENQTSIGKLVGLDALRSRILAACENTAKKAVEFQNAELLADAKAKMAKHYPEQSEAFAAKADLDFFKATGDAKNFVKACDQYAKKVANGDAKGLNKLANDILILFSSDEKCMKVAEKYAKDAAKAGNSHEYYLTYANILLKNGKKKDALAAAEKAVELGKAAGNGAERQAEMLIHQING